MKKNDKKNLQDKTVDELKHLVSDAKKELLKLKFEASKFQLKNTQSMFEKRKDIARMLTKIKEQELGRKGSSRAAK